MATFSHTSSTWIASGLGDSSTNLVNGNLVKAVSATDSLGNAFLELEDSGKSAAAVPTTGTLVSGNLVEASGAGTLIDSGIAAANVSPPLFVTVTLNATQMAAAYATPAALIAAVANKVIFVKSAYITTNSTGQTALATGTAPIIQYAATAHGAGTLATASGLVAGDITAATSQTRNVGAMASAASTGLTDVGVFFSNATGAYTAGTGTTVSFTLEYVLVTATI